MAGCRSPCVSPCCRKSVPAAEDGDPAGKKGWCKSAGSSPCCQQKSKCSPCCSKTPKLPRRNSTSVLSPNHFEAASKTGRSSCCSGPKEPVEYLHFSGDQPDDVFANPSSKKRSSCCMKKSPCCSSRQGSPKRRSSCCSSAGQSPPKRSSCCSSGAQTPKTRTLCRPSSCSSREGGQTSPELSKQSISPSREGICQKLSCKPSTSLPRPHLHGGHSPFLAAPSKTPIQDQSQLSLYRRKGSVYFSQPGASPKPSKPRTKRPRNSPSQSYSILPLRTALEAQGVFPSSEVASCQKSCCKSLPSSQPPKHFHLYRPVSWPAEIPAASTFTKSESPGASPTGSPRGVQPASRSASPCNLFQAPPIPNNNEDAAWTSTTTSPTPTLATMASDSEKRKSILKLSPSRSAVATTTVASRTPDPEQPKSILKPWPRQHRGPSTMVTSSTPDPERHKSILQLSPSKSADASTPIPSRTLTTLAPHHESQSIQICSPLLILNTSRAGSIASTLSQSSTSSSQGNSPSRSASSCFFFARSPKRSRPSRTTLEPVVPNSSTSTSSPFPRRCPTDGHKGSISLSDPTLPTMPPYYCRLPPIRAKIDPIDFPLYHQSARLSYSGAQSRPRTGLLDIPDLAASSPSDLTTLLQESESPSRPASSWFRKPSCAEAKSTPKPEARHVEPGKARNFWTRLWNKSTSLSSGYRSLQDLTSLLTPILSAPKGPANPQYVKDERWIECSDTRAFFIFGVNVVIVIVLTYFVDLLHDGKQKAEAVRALDHSHNSMYCTQQHPPSQYRGYPVYNVVDIK